jgi:pimeloyl-ACP methyl ester carboxylesterase
VDGIWGRHDTTVGNRMDEIGPILRRTDPHATMRVVEDAGHWVIYERAKEFNQVLLKLQR